MKYYFLDFNENFLTNSNPEAEQIDREMDKNDSTDTKIGITQSVLTAKTGMVYILQWYSHTLSESYKREIKDSKGTYKLTTPWLKKEKVHPTNNSTQNTT